MRFIYRSLWVFAFSITLIACKNETKETTKSDEPVKVDTIVKREKKVLTEEEKALANSVFSKVMITPELKMFASYMVSAELADLLIKQKGPYTVMAPIDTSFGKLDTEELNNFLKLENKESLITLMKCHIIEGNHDSVSLIQNIRNGGGTYTLKTISGETLTASKQGDDIVIKNTKGSKGIIKKSDINGSNGVVHTIDALLLLN